MSDAQPTSYVTKLAAIHPSIPKGMNKRDSPLLEQHGKLYVRYDKMEARNAIDGFGNILHTFSYLGRDVFHLRVEGIRYDSEQTMTLSGIDGRMEFNIRRA